jgi:transcriptional regulator with XRE-family HTH domain
LTNSPPISEILGTRIAIARKSKNLSQKELAAILSVSPSFLSKIERGKRNLSAQMFCAIALELGVEEKDLNPYRSVNIWGNPRLPI